MNIFAQAGILEQKGEEFAFVTIISSKGSAPRNEGKMIVKKDGDIIGTIGGGLMEAFVIDEALEALMQKESRIAEYTLNSDVKGGIQMMCGGEVKFFIEAVMPKPRILMIGAGHVGNAVARLVEFLGYNVIVVDEREDYANEQRFPMAMQVVCEPDISEAVEKVQIDSNTFIIIATKDSDMEVLRKVVASDAAYIGMIGSRRKVAKVFERLKADGVPEERIQAVHAPVGLDIGSETPEEIAVSILAEIMAVRSKKTAGSLKEIGKNA